MHLRKVCISKQLDGHPQGLDRIEPTKCSALGTLCSPLSCLTGEVGDEGSFTDFRQKVPFHYVEEQNPGCLIQCAEVCR